MQGPLDKACIFDFPELHSYLRLIVGDNQFHWTKLISLQQIVEIGGCAIKSRLKMSVGIDSDGESEPLLAPDQVCGEFKPICNCGFV